MGTALDPRETRRSPARPSTPRLDRERFLLALVQELAESLRDVVGEHDATGYLNLACCAVAEQLEQAYLQRLGVDRLDQGQLSDILSDFQAAIGHGQPVVDDQGDRLVISRLGCGCMDAGMGGARPTFCDIVTSVVGHLTAQACGYASVATHDPVCGEDGFVRCRIVLDLVPRVDAGGSAEFFRRDRTNLV